MNLMNVNSDNFRRPKILGLSLAALLALALAACDRGVGIAPTTSSPASNADQQGGAVNFSQFADIPIPTGSKMNLDRTLVLGNQDEWIGRLALSTSHNTTDMFNFFKQKTPEFGWQEVTSVRSAISVLTYTRESRVMTIQLQGKTISGSEVDITVSPRGGAAPATATSTVTPPPSRPPVTAR